MTRETPKTKGPWVHRFAIRFLSVVLAVLVYWLLGFVVRDIGSIQGPSYWEFESRHLDSTLVNEHSALAKKIEDLNRQINERKVKQDILRTSSESLERTLGQLLELQKVCIQKGTTLPDEQQKAFTDSLNLFLDNQKRYQEIQQGIATLVDERDAVEAQKRSVEERLEAQRAPARAEYARAARRHELKLAGYKLLVLVPILAVAAALVGVKRRSIYFPMFLAFGLAVLVKVSLVIHEHFPSRFFRYVLLFAALLVVVRLLIYFIRAIAFPKPDWLLRQYREAYERFLCPVCEYPIRRGPLKYLFWNRKSAKNLRVQTPEEPVEPDYVCPACGTRLYEECPSCHKPRHSLLAHCEHCGHRKPETAGDAPPPA